MTHPNKRKGNQAELAVTRALHELGWPNAERTRSGWTDDRGDIDGIPGIVIEVKNHQKLAIPEWLKELDTETLNAQAEHGVLVVKRRGTTDAKHWYAIQEFGHWCRLLKDAGW